MHRGNFTKEFKIKAAQLIAQERQIHPTAGRVIWTTWEYPLQFECPAIIIEFADIAV